MLTPASRPHIASEETANEHQHPISEETADALYDAATAQYAHQTLKLLRREYDLASPREQEAIDNLIERGAQIVFNSDLPEAYVTVDKWQRINPHKWGIDDWADSIRKSSSRTTTFPRGVSQALATSTAPSPTKRSTRSTPRTRN